MSAPRRGRPAAPGPFAPTDFDGRYFERYYGGDPVARVHGQADVDALARGVAGLADYWHLPLSSALDIGAGTGLWKTALEVARPGLDYLGVDLSPFACQRYGHTQRDISHWRGRRRYDLVVCQGVLQYLDDQAAADAIENIAAMAKGLLYFEALTRHDVNEVIDLTRSDAAVNVRPGAFYRKLLRPHFVAIGCGLFCARTSGAVFFELETAESWSGRR